jgi:hypothetical protein
MRFASVDQCIQPTTISLSPLTLASQFESPHSAAGCGRGSSASTRLREQRTSSPSMGFTMVIARLIAHLEPFEGRRFAAGDCE